MASDDARLLEMLDALGRFGDWSDRVEFACSIVQAGSAATVGAHAERLLSGASDEEIRAAGSLLVAISHEGGQEEKEWTRALVTTRIPLEGDPRVLSALIDGLAGLHDRSLEWLVLPHVGHEHARVRWSCAAALHDAHGEPRSDAAVAALVGLATDPDPDVRNWGLFSLGHSHPASIDTPEVLAALRTSIDDPDEELRYEACNGLALLGDVDGLIAFLTDYDPDREHIEAARIAADPRLVAPLRQVVCSWGGGEADIAAAISACEA